MRQYKIRVRNRFYTIADRLKGDDENQAETRGPGVIETKRGGYDESCFRTRGMRQ